MIFVSKYICIFKDDEDGHFVVLVIIEELMSKAQDQFLDHFARLGVFSKVQNLMGTLFDSDSDIMRSVDSSIKGKL